MSRVSRVRHISMKQPASIERSHLPPGYLEAMSDWHHVRHVAAYQATALLATDDPVLAECAAIIATMAHLVPAADARGVISADEHEHSLIDDYIPGLYDSGLLVLLLAIASTHHGAVRLAAAESADRLIEAGEFLPGWSRELRDPITVGECLAVTNDDDRLIELICFLVRSGVSQAARIPVDEHRCGAALDVQVGMASRLPALLQARQKVDGLLGRASTIRPIEPAEFRGLALTALAARAAHDQRHSLYTLHELAFQEEVGELEPGYLLLATLFRSRLQIFPEATAPSPPHRPGLRCPLALTV